MNLYAFISKDNNGDNYYVMSDSENNAIEAVVKFALEKSTMTCDYSFMTREYIVDPENYNIKVLDKNEVMEQIIFYPARG